jgi:hypothetical protein
MMSEVDGDILNLKWWSGANQHSNGPAGQAHYEQHAVEMVSEMPGVGRVRSVVVDEEDARRIIMYYRDPESEPGLILKREVHYGPWEIVGTEEEHREGWY